MASNIVAEIAQTVEKFPLEDQQSVLRMVKRREFSLDPVNADKIQAILAQLESNGQRFVRAAAESALRCQKRHE